MNTFIKKIATLFSVIVASAAIAAAQPPNDNFANAEIVSGTQVHLVRTNENASKELGETNHAGNIGGKSIWFKWTAPMSRTMIVTTNRSPNNLDTLLHIYTGNAVNTLTSVTFSANISTSPLENVRSCIRFAANAGTTYYIAIDGTNTGAGAVFGQINLDIQPAYPHQAAEYGERDGMTDFAVFRPSTGTWYALNRFNGSLVGTNFGLGTDTPLAMTSNSTALNPRFVFRPSDGSWWRLIFPSFVINNYGQAGDIPVPENYSGTINSDIGVFRPSEGRWIFRLDVGLDVDYVFGQNGDIPVPGQYTPDAFADVAVFRPSNGRWYFRNRTGGPESTDTFSEVQFGTSGDKPVPGDYDGDGLLDPAVFRPSTGTWWVRQSSNGQATAFQWGLSTDIPTTGDFDGDGRFDYAVYRPSTAVWYVFNSETATVTVQPFGLPGDIPVTSNNAR